MDTRIVAVVLFQYAFSWRKIVLLVKRVTRHCRARMNVK